MPEAFMVIFQYLLIQMKNIYLRVYKILEYIYMMKF